MTPYSDLLDFSYKHFPGLRIRVRLETNGQAQAFHRYSDGDKPLASEDDNGTLIETMSTQSFAEKVAAFSVPSGMFGEDATTFQPRHADNDKSGWVHQVRYLQAKAPYIKKESQWIIGN